MNADQPGLVHQPRHAFPASAYPLADLSQVFENAWRAIGAIGALMARLNLDQQRGVPLSAPGGWALPPRVIATHGDAEAATQGRHWAAGLRSARPCAYRYRGGNRTR